MRTILVLGSEKVNQAVIEPVMGGDCEAVYVNSEKEMRAWLNRHMADLLIVDTGLVHENAIEAVGRIKQDARFGHIPVLFLIADTSAQTQEACLGAGGDDFVGKPVVPAVLKKRMERLMELNGFRYGLEEELWHKAKQVGVVTMYSVMSIANAVDSKERYSRGHSLRVAECARDIARCLGWTQEEQQNIHYVGLLHDVGKIGVPETILGKPGKLTEEEWAVIRKHPVIGGEILKEVHSIPFAREGALYHHERYDGTGYPSGLAGEEIPLYARILAIADAYDAMSTARIYRTSFTNQEIRAEFERCRGTQFDPALTDLFIGMLRDGYEVDAETVRKESQETGNVLLDSVLKECMEEAANVSMIDSLTGLYNKAYAQNHVEEHLMGGHGGALFMMDLDNFKHINDAYGHIVGDQILKIFAGAMRKAATKNDILCRTGGDEYLMFSKDLDSREEAEEKAKNIIEAVAEEAEEIHMSTEVFASMGIAFASPGDDFITLSKKADKALYFIKRYGKNSYHFFEDNEDGGEESANNVDISNIRDIIRGRMDFSRGAFNLAYGEFQKVYNFIARYIERGAQSVQIVLLTIEKSGVGAPDAAGLEEVMISLGKAISSSLRSSDVFTRYSSSQYIVILMDISEKNGEMVTNRILDRFLEMNKNEAFGVKSDICRLD